MSKPLTSNPMRYSGAEIHRGLCVDNHKHLRELEYVLASDYERLTAELASYERTMLVEQDERRKVVAERDEERAAFVPTYEENGKLRAERDRLRAHLSHALECPWEDCAACAVAKAELAGAARRQE